MDHGVGRIRLLARRVARAQEEHLREHSVDVAALRTRLQASVRAPVATAPRFAGLLWAGLGAVTVTVVAVALFSFSPSSRPIQFEVGPSEVAASAPSHDGSVGETVFAPSDAILPLRFSDGSVVRLGAGASAKVIGLSRQGAHIALERGSAAADVVHRDDSRWTFTAGPFDIHVVGTSFAVGWEPNSGTFTLSLERGRVAVSGCDLPGERFVGTGETFRMVCFGGHSARSEPTEMEVSHGTPIEAGIADRTDADAGGPRSRTAVGPVVAPTSVHGPESSWESLADSGRYEEAVDAAEATGFSQICGSSDAAKLMKLADAARLARRFPAAKEVLQSVRARFAIDSRASAAAFYLGRIAFDRHAFGEALTWFDTYLAERPGGPLAREAAGRIVETLVQSGDSERARVAATQYLAQYPNGPHAALARSLSGP